MLRAKKFGNLSQSAKSFVLSTSQIHAVDGNSCSYQDEKHLSTNPLNKSKPLATHRVYPTKSESDKGVPNNTLKNENSSRFPSISSSLDSLLTSSAPRSLNDDQEDAAQSSAIIAEQFLKMGIATIGLISDFMNYKIPTLSGGGSLLAAQNFMVDSRPLNNIISSKGKFCKRPNVSKFQADPSNVMTGQSSYSVFHEDPGAESDKPTVEKASRHIQSPVPDNSFNHTKSKSDKPSRRQAKFQRGKQPNNDFSNSKFHNRSSKCASQICERPKSVYKMQPPLRAEKLQNFGVSWASVSVNAGRTVEHICHTLRQLKWGATAEHTLKSLNCKIDVYQANQILKQLQDHTVALGFFHWLKHQSGFKHDGHTYTTMIGILGRDKQFDSINKLLEDMRKDGCKPNVVTYNRLIHSYGRANYLDEALNIFHHMQEVGCKPDRVTYCTLIDLHAKAGFLAVALDMYRRMQETGLTPDTFTYGIIINSLGKAGHLSAASRFFSEMLSQGCTPNLVTYNIMMALQAKARNYKNALKLYRDMQKAGFHPDKVTYSIVMETLGHCGYIDEAETVFEEMKKEEWVPDEPVYGLLVDLWGKIGNIDKAWGWFQEMLDAGLQPNVPTCNSLLSAFLRVNRFADARNILQEMQRLNLQPSLQTYTLLLSCSTDSLSLGYMDSCCELMAITRHPAHAFLLSMPAADLYGQNVRNHTDNFLNLMHSEDRDSKRGLIDAVIDFLQKSDLKEEAGSVWEASMDKNIYPDVLREKSSSYWLINLHIMSDGTAIVALSKTLAWFHSQLLTFGYKPNRIDIVTGWGRRSRITGSSLVRQSVQELLQLFGFPFRENSNSGCFVGCGETLSQWLLNPYVGRMHLL